MLDESLTSRSAKLDTALQHMQTGMQDLTCRLLDITLSMQRLEVKLDSMAQRAIGGEHQQLPQKCVGTSHVGLQSDVHTVQHASTGGDKSVDARCTAKIKVTQEAKPVGTQEVAVWRGILQDQKKTESEHASPDIIRGELGGEDCRKLAGQNRQSGATTLLDLDTKFGIMDKKLERISASMGIKSGVDEGDDEEDRRRLKEKLKDAIDLDRRSRVHKIVSKRQVWLEYIFGICSPDQRIGKRGSRWRVAPAKKRLCVAVFWQIMTLCARSPCRLIHPRSRFASGIKISCCNPTKKLDCSALIKV